MAIIGQRGKLKVPAVAIRITNEALGTAATPLLVSIRDKPINTYIFQIYDVYGGMVLSGESQNVLKTIDTSGLDEGLYFLIFMRMDS